MQFGVGLKNIMIFSKISNYLKYLSEINMDGMEYRKYHDIDIFLPPVTLNFDPRDPHS